MKRLLLAPLLLTLLVASCSNKSTSNKYNSLKEANDACKQWAKEGGTFTIENPKFVVDEEYLKEIPWSKKKLGDVLEKRTYTISVRRCEFENQTKQILGLRVPDHIEKNDQKYYKERCSNNCGVFSIDGYTVKANFYF